MGWSGYRLGCLPSARQSLPVNAKSLFSTVVTAVRANPLQVDRRLDSTRSSRSSLSGSKVATTSSSSESSSDELLTGASEPVVVAVGVSAVGVPVVGVSATGVSATGVSATGVSATGVSATGVSATGVSATGVSAVGVPVVGVSATGVSATGVSATGVSATGCIRQQVYQQQVYQQQVCCFRPLELEQLRHHRLLLLSNRLEFQLQPVLEPQLADQQSIWSCQRLRCCCQRRVPSCRLGFPR